MSKHRVFLLLFCVLNAGLFAQNDEVAEKYQPNEFPEWVKDFRRFDIVAFGSFPFAFFAASFTTDSIRFFQNDNNIVYAPWPFKPAGAYDATSEEKLVTIGVAIGISLTVALIDLIIVSIKRSKRKKIVIPPAPKPIIQEIPPVKDEITPSS